MQVLIHLCVVACNSGFRPGLHYVSGSPWQLNDELEKVIKNSAYPEGSVHLKMIRVGKSLIKSMSSSQFECKMSGITPLMENYPKRKFVFFGDSGQEDLEIYGLIARSFPDQIFKIYIRNITPEIDKDRYNIGHAF